MKIKIPSGHHYVVIKGTSFENMEVHFEKSEESQVKAHQNSLDSLQRYRDHVGNKVKSRNEEIYKKWKQGDTFRTIAEQYDITRGTISKIIKKMKKREEEEEEEETPRLPSNATTLEKKEEEETPRQSLYDATPLEKKEEEETPRLPSNATTLIKRGGRRNTPDPSYQKEREEKLKDQEEKEKIQKKLKKTGGHEKTKTAKKPAISRKELQARTEDFLKNGGKIVKLPSIHQIADEDNLPSIHQIADEETRESDQIEDILKEYRF